jgi:hypothetical protein
MLYRPDRGWGIGEQGEALIHRSAAFKELEERVADLEQRLPRDPSGRRVPAPKPEPPVVEAKSEPQQPVGKP